MLWNRFGGRFTRLINSFSAHSSTPKLLLGGFCFAESDQGVGFKIWSARVRQSSVISNTLLRWIKEWVLVTCGFLWLDLVFSSIFLYSNLRPLCLRPEPLWTLNTPFLDHVTSHAHNYAKFGLCRLHQFTECDHNRFSFHNISFTVK